MSEYNQHTNSVPFCFGGGGGVRLSTLILGDGMSLVKRGNQVKGAES